MRDLRSKRVVITGGSAGLGRAIAIAFAQAGCDVGLMARNAKGLENARTEIAAISQGKVAIAVADMAVADDVAAAAATLEQQLGGIDLWINNAMETVFSPVADMTPEEYRRVTEVTYLGYVYGTLAALKSMTPRREGHIIQIGSALAYRAIPLQSAYCGAKFAIRGFTDSLRSELIYKNLPIRLTTVHMPALNTPQFSWARARLGHAVRPVGTIFQPQLGAQAVLHAARHPRREYWVGGSTIAAIFGTLFLPGFMDRMMARISYRQQWVEAEPMPTREGNLFEAGSSILHTTNGAFTAHAKLRSVSWSLIRLLTR